MLKDDQRFEYAQEEQHDVFDLFVEVNPELEASANYLFSNPGDYSPRAKVALAQVHDKMIEGQRVAQEFWIAYARVVSSWAFQSGIYKGYGQE